MTVDLTEPALCVDDLGTTCTWCAKHSGDVLPSREAALGVLLGQWRGHVLFAGTGEGYGQWCSIEVGRDRLLIERQLGRALLDGELALLADLSGAGAEVGRVLALLDEVRGVA